VIPGIHYLPSPKKGRERSDNAVITLAHRLRVSGMLNVCIYVRLDVDFWRIFVWGGVRLYEMSRDLCEIGKKKHLRTI
jgi:pyruvate/oxaloacetate carboxyltransferase